MIKGFFPTTFMGIAPVPIPRFWLAEIEMNFIIIFGIYIALYEEHSAFTQLI